MNVKEYIESGVVELYAMNALPPEEKKEFERMGIMYPEITDELRRVELAFEEYSIAHAINPRPQLREIIMSKAHGNKEGAKIIPISKQTDDTTHSLTYKYLIAASLAALVISTFASWFFYNRWSDAENRYTSLLNEKNELAINFNVVKATYDETLANMLIIRDERSTVVMLQSTDTTRNFQARVYWNKMNRHAFIDVLSLPEPEEGKQFQLWALVKGLPVDAGVFNTDVSNIQRVKDIESADGWAVTLEPKGGSVSPSLDKMYLINKNS
jgi:hypothetical protein